MSWSVFKSSLLISMQSNAYGNDIIGFAKNFTNLYDATIKTGGDTINKIPLSKGNKELIYTSNKSQTELVERRLKWHGFSQYFQGKFLKYYLES